MSIDLVKGISSIAHYAAFDHKMNFLTMVFADDASRVRFNTGNMAAWLKDHHFHDTAVEHALYHQALETLAASQLGIQVKSDGHHGHYKYAADMETVVSAMCGHFGKMSFKCLDFKKQDMPALLQRLGFQVVEVEESKEEEKTDNGAAIAQ